jgi:hypothetical protein
MHLTGGPHSKERRKRIGGKSLTHDALSKRRYADPAKAVVMAYVKQLVRNGFARRSEAGNGVIELTPSSGEVFHLGKVSITRII